MAAWVLAVGGGLVGAVGMTLAVGTGAVSRVELYRGVAQRLGPARRPDAVLAAPGRILASANGLAMGGMVLSAFGVMGLLARLPVGAGIALVVVVILALLIAVVAVPRAVGARWPEAIVGAAMPWLGRVGIWIAPLVPGTPEGCAGATVDGLVDEAEIPEDPAEVLRILLGVLRYTERPVREVMTPRTEIVAVREGARLEEVAQIFAESGYSRLPVYRDSLDNIVGMIYALDLLKVSRGGSLPLRPVTVAPASKRCADLLFEMQRDRRQFATVLDEYGGTAGIATFQDLLEELVAEVYAGPEEFRAPGETAVDVAELGGATPWDEVAARFDVGSSAQAETVGGVLARAAGRIPQAGERFVLGGLEFDVLAASPIRVERVVVRRAPVPVRELQGGPR